MALDHGGVWHGDDEIFLQGVEPMKKLNLSAIAALLVLSLALGACAVDGYSYAYRDGHGGRGSGLFAD
jgi:hypothetical protein